MQIEFRSDDSVKIVGYVNVCDRESKPIMTPCGKVNEVIKPHVFQNAIRYADNIELLVDHKRKIGDMYSNLSLSEDNVGLRAEVETSDKQVIDAIKSGKIRGWSFGMHNVKDELIKRAGKLPLRKVVDMILDEVSLIINLNPCYSATSVELRAGNTEIRVHDDAIEYTTYDYSKYEARIEAIKKFMNKERYL